MRIVVVLPLPFAPRNPQISPAPTWRLKPSTTCRLPKLLRNPLTFDDVFVHGGATAGITVTGWPGLRSAACPSGLRSRQRARRRSHFGLG
jgi:hypothetical protein